MTPDQKSKTKKLISDEIGGWAGTLYHGSPTNGMLCILNHGFEAACSHDIDVCLLSLSNNENVLHMFGKDKHGYANGFRFKFTSPLKIWDVSEFFYTFLYTDATGDMWLDFLDENPNSKEIAIRLGLCDEDGDPSISAADLVGWFVPKTIDAFIFPHFHSHGGERSEAEIAFTDRGVKNLKKNTDAVIIDYVEYDWNSAREILEELGVEESCQHGE